MQHTYCGSCGGITYFGSVFPNRCSSCGVKFGSATASAPPKQAPPTYKKAPKYRVIEEEYEDDEEEIDLDIDEDALRASIVWAGERISPLTLGDAQAMGPGALSDPLGPRAHKSLNEIKQGLVVRKEINIG